MNEAERVSVDKAALMKLLKVLDGQPHEIRELQACRHPSELFPGNPINQLWADVGGPNENGTN